MNALSVHRSRYHPVPAYISATAPSVGQSMPSVSSWGTPQVSSESTSGSGGSNSQAAGPSTGPVRSSTGLQASQHAPVRVSKKTSQGQKKRERKLEKKATSTASVLSATSEQPQPAAEDPMDLASELGEQCNMDTVSAEKDATSTASSLTSLASSLGPSQAQATPDETQQTWWVGENQPPKLVSIQRNRGKKITRGSSIWSASSSSQGSRKSARLTERVERASRCEPLLPQPVSDISVDHVPERASSVPVDRQSDSDFRLSSPRKTPGKRTHSDMDSSVGFTPYRRVARRATVKGKSRLDSIYLGHELCTKNLGKRRRNVSETRQKKKGRIGVTCSSMGAAHTLLGFSP
ncbi:hypothetical protein N7488_004454 [Penicillium malachiteum]|nr:hypothetical protein N7488_004454 [Penicillium malachiteum]